LKLTIVSSLTRFRSVFATAPWRIPQLARLLAALQFVNQPLGFVEVETAALQ
jgi:hypothetical protein